MIAARVYGTTTAPAPHHAVFVTQEGNEPGEWFVALTGIDDDADALAVLEDVFGTFDRATVGADVRPFNRGERKPARPSVMVGDYATVTGTGRYRGDTAYIHDVDGDHAVVSIEGPGTIVMDVVIPTVRLERTGARADAA